ncbi:hypothetical protein ACFSTC_38095 [Nonomuraea ferruginea]
MSLAERHGGQPDRRGADRIPVLAGDSADQRADRPGLPDRHPPAGRHPPDMRGGRRLDVLGAVLATAALAGLAYGLSDAPAVAFAGAVLLAVFVLVEVRVARAPLIPPRLVRARPIWLGNIAMLLAGACLNPMWYFLTLSLQHVLGYGPLQTGLAFLPHTLLTMLVGLRLTPWLMRRADDRVLIVAGALIGAAGFWWQSRIAPGQDYLTAIASPAVLISLGGGLLNTPLTVTVTSGVAAADAGGGLRADEHRQADRRRARPGRPGRANGGAGRRTC